MKKELLLLTGCCLLSCNNLQNNKTTDSGSDSVAVEGKADVAVSPDVDESTEITLNFSSYHLYTSEDDKYDESGYQPVAAKLTIDEKFKKASLNLYDSGEDKWFPFHFRIDDKVSLQEGVIAYTVYNSANQKGYIYVSTNRPDGLFIDINNFVFGGEKVCCWMQEGGSSGNQYRESTTSIQSTPNTYPSNPSYSPELSGGSIHSEERIYGSYSNYPNYEETNDCVEGVVVYEGDDDYYIVETRKGYTVLERYSGRLYEGDKVRGELNKYNFKYLINRNNNSEVKVYIDDYMLSDDDALEKLGEDNHLKSDDQSAYDAHQQR